MPVTIGAQASTFDNPIGLLSDCHRRIERFLHALVTVTAEAQGNSLNATQRDALIASLKYFHHAAPKHTEDEEQDLFPLLRDARRPELQRVLARVEQLEHEHRTAAQWHREVEELGERWLQRGQLSQKEAIRLLKLLTALSGLYKSHIAAEEKEVFPVAQEMLSESEKTEMGRRMASRRGIAFVPEWAQLKAPELKGE